MSTTEPPTGRAYNSHAHINRSLPNMTAALPKAPKIYPIHLLMTSNYRLPNDVDRCVVLSILTAVHCVESGFI